jgi:hypothetical protein
VGSPGQGALAVVVGGTTWRRASAREMAELDAHAARADGEPAPRRSTRCPQRWPVI